MCDANKVVENAATAGMMCPIPLLEIDACDLENYKHPPFLFILWYLFLAGEKIYEKIKELIGEGGDGGDGGEGGGGKKEEKPEEEEGDAEEEETPAVEAPPEEAAEEEG